MAHRVPDESDFRSRPGKRGSRPRTKQRPDHADAVTGFVTGVDRGRYTLLVDDDHDDERTVVAMKARELGRTRVVCGDRVDLVGDVSGDDGTLARIVRIQERSSVLRRTADDTDPYERVPRQSLWSRWFNRSGSQPAETPPLPGSAQTKGTTR